MDDASPKGKTVSFNFAAELAKERAKAGLPSKGGGGGGSKKPEAPQPAPTETAAVPPGLDNMMVRFTTAAEIVRLALRPGCDWPDEQHAGYTLSIWPLIPELTKAVTLARNLHNQYAIVLSGFHPTTPDTYPVGDGTTLTLPKVGRIPTGSTVVGMVCIDMKEGETFTSTAEEIAREIMHTRS